MYLYHVNDNYWEVPRKVRPYGYEGEEEKDTEADEVTLNTWLERTVAPK